jgi:sigma-B regulation protein RsbU (phosphoserine phosphatase)
MMTVTPVTVLGKRWYLMISSRLATAEAIVNGLFRRALYWAIFVVVAMTAILVSTSIWLIRGRMRLERIRHEMLTKELTQAREIQKAWLPQKSPDVPDVDVSAVNHPASHISGDFYNWFELPDGKLVVAIGDVTGHGMSAAFLMATTQLLVRNTMPRIGDPGACLEEVNRQLCMQAFNGQFVTMLIAVIDVENAELHVATAGHYPPLMGNGSAAPFLPLQMEPELVLGVDPESEYRTETFDLPAGASLLMYTDGVLDLEAPGGKRFGKDGLRKTLAGRFETAQAIIDHVVADLDRFRDRREIPDDLTLVAVQLTGSPARRPEAVAVG